MIELLFMLAWLVPTILTFRYTGHIMNEMRMENHPFASICRACKCKRCGRQRAGHWEVEGYGRSCKSSIARDSDWEGMHPFALCWGFVLALLWPAFWSIAGIVTMSKKFGVERGSFFRPMPEVKTREQKLLEKAAEKDARILKLQKRNKELEKELGIGA